MFSPRYKNTITAEFQLLPERVDALKLWQNEINQELRKPKDKLRAEKQMHEQFFTDIFEKVLGYKKRSAGNNQWTITSEYATDLDATRPDGCLGVFTDEADNADDVQAVIELKSLKTDLI
ncbi:MAG: hypothetical protein K0U45_06955 [Alphaproteobacteria bacterium]|nr:hypothetical protein [Alphaproteobacteria bacterium]